MTVAVAVLVGVGTTATVAVGSSVGGSSNPTSWRTVDANRSIGCGASAIWALPSTMPKPRVAISTSEATAERGERRGATNVRPKRAHGDRPAPIPFSTPRLTVGLAGRWGRSRSPRASTLVCSAKREQTAQPARWVISSRLSTGSSGPSMRAEIRAWARRWVIIRHPPRRPARRHWPPGRARRTLCGRGTGGAWPRSR